MKRASLNGIRAFLLAAHMFPGASLVVFAADGDASELPDACISKHSATAGTAASAEVMRARHALREGESLLRVEVGSDGRPGVIALEVSAGSTVLDHRAIEAVAGWILKPSADQVIYLPIRFEESPAAPRARLDGDDMPRDTIAATLDDLCSDARTHVTRLPDGAMLHRDGTSWSVHSIDQGAGRLLVRTRSGTDRRGKPTIRVAYTCESDRRACRAAFKQRHPGVR